MYANDHPTGKRHASATPGRDFTAGIVLLLFSLSLAAICWGIASPALGLTIEEEKSLGKTFYDKLEKDGLLAGSPSLDRYVQSLGERLLAQASGSPFEFRFSILRGNAINAFATPGGYVYVNSGLVGLVETESQLAAVMAHEIAHVRERHIAESVARSQKLSLATLAVMLAGAFLGAGTDAAAAVTGLSMAAASSLSLKYSRDQEEEADRLGMAYMTGAGYNGQAMLQVLQLMKKFEYFSNNIPSYFFTHPGTDDRIRYLDGLLHSMGDRGGSDDGIGGFHRFQTALRLTEVSPEANSRHFRQILASRPDDVDALYGLAVTEERLGRFNQAMDLFRQALARSPDDGDILRDMGIAQFRAGQHEQAKDSLTRALRVDGRNVQALLAMGRTHAALGEHGKAVAAFQSAATAGGPPDPDIDYHLAVSYGRLRQMGDSHYHFGKHFKARQKLATARFHFQEALKYVPGDSLRYAEILHEMKTEKP